MSARLAADRRSVGLAQFPEWQSTEKSSHGLAGLAEEVMRLAKHDPTSKKPFSKVFTSSCANNIMTQISAAACHFSLTGLQLAGEVRAIGSKDLSTQATRVIHRIDKSFSSLYKSCSLIVQTPVDFSHRTTAINSLLDAMVWIKELANIALLLDKIKISRHIEKTKKCIVKLAAAGVSHGTHHLQRMHRKMVGLFRQYLKANGCLSKGAQASSMKQDILLWSEHLMTVINLASKTGLCMPSADHEKRSYGETSTWQRLLAILSACMDKLKTILEQEEDYVGTRSKRNSKADKVAGSLLRQLALFEHLAAREPPNTNRAALETHTTELRKQWNNVLQLCATCIDLRNHDYSDHHPSNEQDGNDIMSSRQTKAELAVEDATLAINSLLASVSQLPSNNKPRDLKALKYFDDSLNKLLPSLGTLRRRLYRVAAEHYVNLLACTDPSRIYEDLEPHSQKQSSIFTFSVLRDGNTFGRESAPRSRGSPVEFNLGSPMSPVSAASSMSLGLSLSPSSRSKTPSPSSPVKPFSPLQHTESDSPRGLLAIEELSRGSGCALESDFLKLESSLEEECQRLNQMCKSVSLLAKSDCQSKTADFLPTKLKSMTDTLLACCEEHREVGGSRQQSYQLTLLEDYCVERGVDVHWVACSQMGSELPLIDIVSCMDSQITDSMEACQTFAQMYSADLLCKTLAKTIYLSGHLLMFLRKRCASCVEENLKSSRQGFTSPAFDMDIPLLSLASRLEDRVLPEMKRLQRMAKTPALTLRADLKRLGQMVMEYLGDLHMCSRQLAPSTGWNQADLDYSDDEREEQGADIIASGTLHTIHEAPQDGDFFHSRAINLSTIAEESELSDEDEGFGLKRSQSLSRRSSLRASCRMSSLPELPLVEENELTSSLFQEWPWARDHIRSSSNDLFEAVEHSLSFVAKSKFPKQNSDLSKLVKLCQVQWEEINEQCLAMLKAILGDSLPQQLVALYTNTSLICHQLTSTVSRSIKSSPDKMEPATASSVQKCLYELRQSVVETLATTRRYTVIRKSHSKSRSSTGQQSKSRQHEPIVANMAQCTRQIGSDGEPEYFI